MSLPPEQFEALLNEYLDDALSGPRLAAVEQALEEDPAVVRRLEELRAERAERLVAMRDDPRFAGARLDSEFSQRVWQAIAAEQANDAVAVDSVRRRSASVADSTRPAGTRDTRRTARWRRPATALVSLAAALLFAVTLFRGGEPQHDPSTLVESGVTASGESPEKASVVAIPESLETPDPDALVDSVLDPEVDAMPEASNTDVASAAVPRSATPNTVEAPELNTVPEPNTPGTPEMAIADAVPSRDPEPALEPKGVLNPNNALMALNVVLVYEVTRTELGKANDAVMRSLRAAGIDVQAQRAIDQQVVGYLQKAQLVDTSEDRPERATILYIEASGKALDRFMVSMFGDMDNIQEIRWNMATDPPLMAAVKHLHQVSATDVRHAEDSSTAWQLVSGSGEQSDFAISSQPRELTPLKRDRWEPMSSESQGPDIQSRLILLVR